MAAVLLAAAPCLAYQADVGVVLPHKLTPDTAPVSSAAATNQASAAAFEVAELARQLRPSVAERTEDQAANGVTITYYASFPTTTPEHGGAEVEMSFHRKSSEGLWMRQPKGHVQLLREAALASGAASSTPQMRCGFSWDDAAAKVGKTCMKDFDCIRPKESFKTWPKSAKYSCYADLPDYERGDSGDCYSSNQLLKSDLICQVVCNGLAGWCDPSVCTCEKNSEAWNVSAPIQPHDDTKGPSHLPKKDSKILEMERKDWDASPSGLPACRWSPNKGCSNETQYECFQGANAGKCSADNWSEKPESVCERSCVHVSLLKPSPYYAIWIPGTLPKPAVTNERQPRYEHDPSKLTPEARGIDLYQYDVLMSRFCRSAKSKVVGIAMYSPHYKEKASRLLRSCERVGMCCKATQIPADAFGKDAMEGTEDFRFKMIAMKPSFILSQIDATDLPVVYLDTDLEFHRFPDLFLPGSWPHSDTVDVSLFNFWGNETLPETKNKPNIGSAVAYFNSTDRAKSLLRVWAEAMAYGSNSHAPDDQVLDLLLTDGEWLGRASFGWLPTSYLRLMPSFYRGVVPVIDHDHGSAPGINGGHSDQKPKYPPIKDMELCQPDAKENKGLDRYLPEAEAEAEAEALKEAEEACRLHGRCDDSADTASAPLASPSPSPASSPVPPVGQPARTPVPYPTSASPSPSPVPAEAPVARTPVPVPSPGRFQVDFEEGFLHPRVTSQRFRRMSQLDA